MFSIFKRRKDSKVTDLAWLGVDIHSHLLPGIDDGAKDVEESISFIKRLHNLGFSKLICTPHIFTELYPNTRETILSSLQKVRDALTFEDFKIEMGAAAEYMIDDTFRVEGEHLVLADNYLLIEMSYLNESPNIEQVIFELQIKGYKIVLAHPERYNFYHQSHDRYRRLKDMGCLFQLNLLSILGYYGKPVKVAAEYLLEKQLYDFAATDLHHDKHLSFLELNVQNGELHSKVGHYNFRNAQVFSV